MLVKLDYNCIGQVAQHCDNEKLCIAENEALQFDLSQLYCSFWSDVLDIWNEILAYELALIECEEDPECDTPPDQPIDYELKRNLILGGTYDNCKGKTIKHQGVKTVLIYYSYSRYLIINGYSDTASGLVQKTNDFSLPVDLKQLQMYADKYRNMGKIAFDGTLHFLCANKTTFDWFDAKECGYCGCGSDKCGGTKAKGYGFRSSNISKPRR